MNSVPFNSIGQIIANNGVQSIALMLIGGRSEQSVALELEGRYDGIPQNTIDTLIEMAQGGIAAAGKITKNPVGVGVNLNDVPVIPGILGDNSEGNRFATVTEAQSSQSGEWITSYNFAPTFESLDNLFDEIYRQWVQWACDYPDFAARTGIECPDSDTTEYLMKDFGRVSTKELSDIFGVDVVDRQTSRLVFAARAY